MVKYTFFFIIVLVTFTSCHKSLSVSKPKKNAPKITEYSEDLSVFVPNYSTPEKKETPAQTVITKKDVPTLKIDDTKAVEDVLLQMKESNKLLNNGLGYRIFVFSGNSKEEFEAAKNYLYRTYPTFEVYESYSQPTYKIKMGDFFRKSDTDEYIDNLKARFGTARLVYEKINTKKAAEIK